MPDVLHTNLLHTVDAAAGTLRSLDQSAVREKPAPTKWSKVEILGHLVDSAANNLPRFILAQQSESPQFSGYDQDAWVASQDYANYDWQTLTDLWVQLNHHIASLVSRIPSDYLPRRIVNGAEITFRTPEGAVTLEYLIEDYIVHIQHHLNQIIPA